MKMRGVGAVAAGVGTDFVLSLGTDVALHAAHFYPAWGRRMSDGQFVLATAYRLVFGVASGYVTARLAPNRPMRYAVILGVVGLALSLPGVAASVAHPEMGPLWYAVAIAASAIPCAWAGGKLHQATA